MHADTWYSFESCLLSSQSLSLGCVIAKFKFHEVLLKALKSASKKRIFWGLNIVHIELKITRFLAVYYNIQELFP